MHDVIELDSVTRYNEFFGLPTTNPLISVVDMKEATKSHSHFTFNYGLYALFLKNTRCGDIRYGRQTYDYQEGTVTSFAPGQVVEVDNKNASTAKPSALGLVFHPDLILGTHLGREIRNYSFFSYSSTEALHLSEDERKIFVDCLELIKKEIASPADKFSRKLIVKNIELLLDYCMRFYSRQFDTREVANNQVLAKFENLLEDYFTSDKPEVNGLPSVRYFADNVCLSPNYFGDLIKKSTGKTAQEYIQNKIINVAKEKILGSDKSISQISYELGFQYSQHFSRLFKKNVGFTPNEFRSAHN